MQNRERSDRVALNAFNPGSRPNSRFLIQCMGRAFVDAAATFVVEIGMLLSVESFPRNPVAALPVLYLSTHGVSI